MLRLTTWTLWPKAIVKSHNLKMLQQHHSFDAVKAIPLRYLATRPFSDTRRATAPNQEKLRVLFFGTDDFAARHLKSLIVEKGRKNSCIESIELVCPPDKRTGRKLELTTPSATKGVAELYTLPVHHTPAQAKTLDGWQMPQGSFDIGVVVSFGYFIPPHVIHSFKYGAVNVHPSLLPKYRGAAPIQHTILAGDEKTGVTVQELDDREFDAGRILAQAEFDLSDEEAPRYRELKNRLAELGSNLLVDTLQHLHKRKANAVSQDVSKATKAPKIKKEWSEVDFNEMAAWQIEQLHRAIGDQFPLRTTFTFTRIKRSKKVKQRYITLQLLNIFLPNDSPLYTMNPPPEPGTFYYNDPDQTLHVYCADGNVVGLTHIKAENKNAIGARDFNNGYEIRDCVGKFGIFTEDDIEPGMSGVRVTKRRHEYAKSIRRRMGIRKQEYERLFKLGRFKEWN